MKKSGWFGDPFRHSLASKGIKSSEVGDILQAQGQLEDLELLGAKADVSWRNMTPQQRFEALQRGGFDPNEVDITAPYHEVIDFWIEHEMPNPVEFEESLINHYTGVVAPTFTASGIFKVIPICDMKSYLRLAGVPVENLKDHEVKRQFKWFQKYHHPIERKHYERKLGWRT